MVQVDEAVHNLKNITAFDDIHMYCADNKQTAPKAWTIVSKTQN